MVEDCDRIPAGELQEGTQLQLFTCNGKPNQDFELTSNRSGRVRNPFTGLCLEIVVPCRDHEKTPPCKRLHISELGGVATVQISTCHNDSNAVSDSDGSQLWDFQDGFLKNEDANLCSGPRLDADNNMVAMTVIR